MNTNAIHQILNIILVVIGIPAALAAYFGCTTLATGALDCSASTIIPPSWFPIILTVTGFTGALKLFINALRDGLGGLFSPQPPVQK